MSKRWYSSLLVTPLIVSAAACNVTNNTTETAGTATASTTNGGTESDSATDGTSTTDGTSETETSGSAGAVTIYDIQQGKVPVDSVVEIKNVVLTTPVMYDEGAVFVQEMAGGEYSGIYLYMYSEVIDGLELAPGDVVNVKGTYTEFYDFSEITVTSLADLQVVSSGPVPAPALVNAADVGTGGSKAEAYESVLVKVEGVMVTDADPGFGEFEVDGVLRIDDFFYPFMGPEVNNGDVFDSIVGPLMWNFDNFKIAPRSLDDLEGGGGSTTSTTGDTDTDTDSTSTSTTGDEDVTIYDLQTGKVNPKTDVILKDVIVTSPLSFSGDSFFVQDPAGGEHSGIIVFVKNKTGLAAVKPGDLVTLTGYYDEYFENSQMVLNTAAGLSIDGTMPVPEPEVLNAADIATGGPLAEAYEGVLVSVEGVSVTNPDAMFGEFVVTGNLRVDDFFFAMANWPKVMMGELFMSITGPLNYNFDNTKVCPRTLADLQK